MESLMIAPIIAALLAPMLFAIVNHSDQMLVEKTASQWGLIIFSSLFGFFSLLLAIIIVLITQSSLILPWYQVVILVISGFLEIIWIYWYLKALAEDHIHSVVSWFQMIPVFIAVLSMLFLKEVISPVSWIGIVVAVIGAMILSYDWSTVGVFKIKPTLYMLASAGIVAIGSVLYKYAAIDTLSFWVGMVWVQLGVFLTGIILLLIPSKKHEFMLMMRENKKHVIKLSVLNEICNLAGLMFVLYASFHMPLHLVYALGALQPLFVVIIGFFLIRYQILPKEESSRKVIVMRFIGMVCMIIAGILIF